MTWRSEVGIKTLGTGFQEVARSTATTLAVGARRRERALERGRMAGRGNAGAGSDGQLCINHHRRTHTAD